MSPLSPPVQAVIELFQGPLVEQRFADVDAAALTTLARAAEAAAAEVAKHEAQLADLRQILADRQEALLVLAQRGLAYARVYAEHDEALSEQLARINLPRASKPRKASPKPASSERAASEASATLESEEPAESGMGEVSAASALEAPALEEPALEEPPTEGTAQEAKRAAKGKRRSSISRDDEQSSEASS
jgi:hypothetical protein